MVAICSVCASPSLRGQVYADPDDEGEGGLLE